MKMRNRTIIIVLCLITAAAFALGTTGAASLADVNMGQDSVSKGNDRLIGVFVTPEHLDLFDDQRYFEDNAEKLLQGGEISEAAVEQYSGRLYAELVDRELTDEETGEVTVIKEYEFTTVEGAAYFAADVSDGDNSYTGSSGDEGISDGHMAFSEKDEGDSISLEGTIYISTLGGYRATYCNPVYQTPEGEVYAVTGTGMSMGGDLYDGMSHSVELSEETKYTSNGETKGYTGSVKITVCYMTPPEKTVVIQLDKSSAVLSREEYAPGKLPGTMKTEPGTSYIIIETYKTGSDKPERAMYQPGDASLFAFNCRDDGVCVKQWASIEW